MKSQNNPRYPKAGAQGGSLIRKVLALLKSQPIALPIKSHIFIAVSGGSDSVGLAHLIIHLGRKIALPSQITLLHVNHRWRGPESDLDEAFVHQLGKTWGVPVISQKLKRPSAAEPPTEDSARRARKKIFTEVAAQHGAVVLTAHQADDLAETLLWRLFTGAAQTHGGGVNVQQGAELRPFLTIRKSEILTYLNEVGQTYREDSTNQDRKFLRAKMRERLMPEISRIFPRAVEHLVSFGLEAQSASIIHAQSATGLETSSVRSKPFSQSLTVTTSESQSARQKLTSVPDLTPLLLFRAANINVRRPHLEFMLDHWIAEKEPTGEIHLPGGWRLTHQKTSDAERWVIEKI